MKRCEFVAALPCALGQSAPVLSRRSTLFAALVFAALVFGLGQALPRFALAQPKRLPLFFIERSKNENVVHYDLLFDESGAPRRDQPVDVYWRMNAQDGRREELTPFERGKAYGYAVRERKAPDNFTISLAAFHARQIRIRVQDGHARALLLIAGQGAVLDRLFIQTREGIMPQVQWIDLYGHTADGTPLYERVTR